MKTKRAYKIFTRTPHGPASFMHGTSPYGLIYSTTRTVKATERDRFADGTTRPDGTVVFLPPQDFGPFAAFESLEALLRFLNLAESEKWRFREAFEVWEVEGTEDPDATELFGLNFQNEPLSRPRETLPAGTVLFKNLTLIKKLEVF